MQRDIFTAVMHLLSGTVRESAYYNGIRPWQTTSTMTSADRPRTKSGNLMTGSCRDQIGRRASLSLASDPDGDFPRLIRGRPAERLHYGEPLMKIAVLRETADAEHRVAAHPETVKKLIGLGASSRSKAAPVAVPISRMPPMPTPARRSATAPVSSAAPIWCLACRAPPLPTCRDQVRAPCSPPFWRPLPIARRVDGYAKAGYRRRWPWNSCRASPARSRWTYFPRSRTLPATRR